MPLHIKLVRKKELEIMLESLEKIKNPKAELEQYETPSTIAAYMLWHAYQNGDIYGRKVIDLGCGNGIFAIGAALLGGDATGIDIDEEAIKIAENNAKRMGVNVRFLKMDISSFNEDADTVLMNPPFGAQHSNRKADRKFIEKAMEIAPSIYLIEQEVNFEFIKKIFGEKFSLRVLMKFNLPMKARMKFHRKRVVNVPSIMLHAMLSVSE